jgi:3,4-dihydroxy 2-butanone 4-phosphate synthase/GTP cyclohydrolase II
MVELRDIARSWEVEPDADVSSAVEALAMGRLIVLVADDGAHLVLSGARATTEAMRTMADHGHGVLKVTVAPERLATLGIASLEGSGGYHAPVDLVGRDRPGDPAARAATVRALADPSCAAADFRRPGHVFPVANRGGSANGSSVTAVASGLAGIATGAAVAAYSGAVDEDGGPADSAAGDRLARALDLPIVSVADVVAYRERVEPAVERLVSATLPTTGGEMSAVAFRSLSDGREYTAFVRAGRQLSRAAVHVQFSCAPGEVFGGATCACGRLLDAALAEVGSSHQVIVVHTPHPDPLRHLAGERPAPGAPPIEHDLADLLWALGVREASFSCNEDLDVVRLAGERVRVLFGTQPRKEVLNG